MWRKSKNKINNPSVSSAINLLAFEVMNLTNSMRKWMNTRNLILWTKNLIRIKINTLNNINLRAKEVLPLNPFNLVSESAIDKVSGCWEPKQKCILNNAKMIWKVFNCRNPIKCIFLVAKIAVPSKPIKGKFDFVFSHFFPCTN